MLNNSAFSKYLAKNNENFYKNASGLKILTSWLNEIEEIVVLDEF